MSFKRLETRMTRLLETGGKLRLAVTIRRGKATVRGQVGAFLGRIWHSTEGREVENPEDRFDE